MRVETTSGKVYKIQFVHSSHDFNTTAPMAPGGLRQFVDNLARSVRRRVTFCDISSVEAFAGDGMGNPDNIIYTSLAQGFTLCYYKDQFEKKTGRVFALDRALLNSELSHDEEDEIWEACGFSFYDRPSQHGGH